MPGGYDYTYKILLLGDASVGKTSLVKRYCYNVFNPGERLTIGVDFHVKMINLNNKKLKLQIWDVGGEERFRFLLPTYVLGSNAAFLLYDTTRASSLDNIPEWVAIVRNKAGNVPIGLLGAKSDLATEQRAVPEVHGKSVAEKHDIKFFKEISSKNNVNVAEAFNELSDLTMEKMNNK